MKTSNYLIIGAIIIGAYFLIKKKPLKIDNKNSSMFVYPTGITEGMRVIGENGDGTQYIIKNGKKYGITLDQWIARGYDPYIVIDAKILDLIPSGGILN